MFSPAKKVVLIFLLFLVCAFISVKRDLSFKFGRFEFKKDLNLSLGLDLAGGSHLVFEADLSKISPHKQKSAVESLKNIIERRVNLFGVSEPNVQTSSFGGHERVVVDLPGVKDTKEASALIGATAQLVFAEVEEVPADTGATPSAEFKFTDLTGAYLSDAKVTFDSNVGKPVVAINFTQEGGQKFAELTKKNVGKPLAIFLDDEIISAPIVQEEITGGSAVISGNFTLDEAKKLVIQLNAGALPVPVSLVEERTIGPALGVESVSKSIRAGLVGLSMVLLFMVLSYGKLGLVADFALIVFAAITLALYKLIPVTLTLPGIAGFLLSVGMAVDSNILIFERFKEERRQRDLVNALEVSFGRAWDSIRDANIATLVTAFILANPLDWQFLHTSGPVRGFALTLALGIVISLFTGVVVSRNLLRVFVTEGKR